MRDSTHKVLSLFSSAGIGELGVKAAGFNILLSNEMLADRCALYKENNPETQIIEGDIWRSVDAIISQWKRLSRGSPFLVYATPPCQGMSFNGIGKLMAEIRAGRRPKEDPRNRLIIPTVKVIKELRPQWVLLENVPTMENTIIRTEQNEYKRIVDYLQEELAPEYIGRAEVVNCADYGIPQTRVRLITILTRNAKGKRYFKTNKSFLPRTTHSETDDSKLPHWVTLRDAIGHLPPLSSEVGKNQDKHIPWHIVPVMKPDKYWWISNTPYGETAYNIAPAMNYCESAA